MIFQAGIQLDVENRDVQVNFDFDTGLIGFTENIDGHLKEYFYRDSPGEFKKAFFEKFENLYANDRHLNYKICQKNRDVIKAIQQLSENKDE